MLADAVEQVLIATAREPGMPVLAGLRIEARHEAVTLTATDRSRLHPNPGAGQTTEADVGRHGQAEGMRNSNSGRSHGTAGGFANAVPVRTAPTRW
ncbi:hypothetical protein [Streptomyces puniciscabiei]|uniref:DNA polymerase III subunit beta family protein n=1 Tax=Streptomyces puniciscabiei TaxID=164348 RepID=UPI0037B923A1